jgi:Amino acid permease
MYGIVFIILGNLSGNAIAFGIYVMSAAGYDDPSRGSIIGLAIGALSCACLVHVASRRGGIILNNIFAVVKVAILLLIIILGFIRSRGYTFGGHANADDFPTTNFELNKSFKGDMQNAPSFADALLLSVFTYSGFKQPFYVSVDAVPATMTTLTDSPQVLSEVKAPRRRFPKYTLIAMLITALLFLLVNISYVSKYFPSEVLATKLTARSVLRYTKSRNLGISAGPGNAVLPRHIRSRRGAESDGCSDRVLHFWESCGHDLYSFSRYGSLSRRSGTTNCTRLTKLNSEARNRQRGNLTSFIIFRDGDNHLRGSYVGPTAASNAQPDRDRSPRADTSCGTCASLVLIHRPHRSHLLFEA